MSDHCTLLLGLLIFLPKLTYCLAYALATWEKVIQTFEDVKRTEKKKKKSHITVQQVQQAYLLASPLGRNKQWRQVY